MTTSIRTAVNGMFTRSTLRDLLKPIAWQGTVDAATRDAEESAIRSLVEDALAALDANPDAGGVEIVGGEVTATIAGE
jgi:hypothetical protein